MSNLWLIVLYSLVDIMCKKVNVSTKSLFFLFFNIGFQFCDMSTKMSVLNENLLFLALLGGNLHGFLRRCYVVHPP